MSSVDLSQFHQTFFDESLEGLDTMETTLLALGGQEADPELVNTIFRAAHSIKGGAATFGFADIASFTHIAESLLDEVRNGHRQATPPLIDLFLRCVDTLRQMFARVMSGQAAASADSDALKAELAAYAQGGMAPAASTQATVAQSAVCRQWRIKFLPKPSMYRSGNDSLRVFKDLAAAGRLKVVRVLPVPLESWPALEGLAVDDAFLGWDLELFEADRSAVEEVFEWLDGDCEVSIEELVERRRPAQEPTPVEPRAAASRHESGSIRVDITKVDALIDMVGELVITQAMLQEARAGISSQTHPALLAGLAALARHTRDLQDMVMGIRMLPIGQVFNRFPRVVHDLENKLGKKVRLSMLGEHTEVDKTVMEKIGDPLTHLVRNAIDHGLETPERRLAAGKQDTGTLQLEAFHRGGNVVVEISDDGAGLNRPVILAKALERGIISSGEGMTDAAIDELIFQPGFSTAAQTTDLSGRGVGMDVVRKNVAALGGVVRVRSQTGKGSTFTITLPLTLAIIDGLVARVGVERYILPLVSIVESVRLGSSELKTLPGGSEVFSFRDQYLPLVRLKEVFHCPSPEEGLQSGVVVVVECDSGRLGILVDELLGQQQAVVKPLEAHYQRVTGLQGATVLGDGSVALIIDVDGLRSLAKGSRHVS
ncbi:chemotaxis protein CheA [Frateuria aurantia]